MENNKHYEVMLIMHPNQKEQINATLDKYQNLITKQGGKVNRLENWGRRELAYTIQNLNKAMYVLLNIECDQKTLDELNQSFYYNDLIIRVLVLKREFAITEPSVMIRDTVVETQEATSSTE